LNPLVHLPAGGLRLHSPFAVHVRACHHKRLPFALALDAPMDGRVKMRGPPIDLPGFWPHNLDRSVVQWMLMDHEETINFTDSAARKVRELTLADGNPDLKLRVYITGGGCSGFQYGFTFDEKADEDDIRVERAGVELLVDPLSFQYLEGSEVDYSESLQGARFVIRNPNASTTCGCGSSFGVA